MRVTGGRLRGRRIPSPAAAGIRPTPSRVREALFNMLGGMEGRTMLDVFAGSGVMSLEAISRGAREVISVDAAHAAVRAMRAIRREWGLEGAWRIIQGQAHAALGRLAGRCVDIVFADPPYATGLAGRLPAWLDEHGIGCDILVIEESARITPAWPAGWTATRSRRHGDTCLHFLRRTNDDAREPA